MLDGRFFRVGNGGEVYFFVPAGEFRRVDGEHPGLFFADGQRQAGSVPAYQGLPFFPIRDCRLFFYHVTS